jgi:hypothetical protein
MTIAPDTSLFKLTTPSLRLTPNDATFKAESAPLDEGMKAVVASGQTLTIWVWVRKSSAYNGNQPRIMLRRNDAIGVTADVQVGNPMSIAKAENDTDTTIGWEQLTGTTPAATANGVMEFIVDCDGTAGWINIDSPRITGGGANQNDRQEYWFQGLPFQGLTPATIPSNRIITGY